MGKKLPSKTAKKRVRGDVGAQSALRAPISFFCLSFVFLCFFFPLLPFFLLLSSPYFLPSLFFFFFFFFFFSLSFTLLPFFLSISLFADRAQGARSFNGGPNAAPILAEGGAESRNTGFPGKSAAFFGEGNRKSARANFGWNGRIFLERSPNRNVGPLCFGELSYFRSNPRAPPESQISAGGMSLGIPAGSGGGGDPK